MTIDAVNLNRVPCLAVEFAVAMAVLLEVTVDAVHAFLKVNVFQVHGFLELFRIFERNWLVFLVQQRAFAVMLKHGSENPAVTVKVSELCSIELPVEFGRASFLKKLHVRPQPPRRRALRIS